MQIRNMPAEERPQEKMIYGGADRLSTAELLALIIRTGSQSKSAIQLAEEVIAYAKEEAGELDRVDVAELMKVDGIGASKACSIVASMELARRVRLREGNDLRQIRCSQDVADLLMHRMRGLKQERVVVLLMNAKCEVESEQVISIGELSSTSIHPREVFCQAVRRSAAGIIVVHNHPSGDPSPSDEDLIATQRLLAASRIIGIRLLDHIIIGYDTYFSMKAEGLMDDEDETMASHAASPIPGLIRS